MKNKQKKYREKKEISVCVSDIYLMMFDLNSRNIL